MSNFSSQPSKLVFIINISLLTGLILFYPQANTWAVNIEEEVIVSADHMFLNFESGSSVYTGNVKASQGKLVLTGDKITIQQSNNIVKRIIVIGKPARYHHVMDDGETITAQSEKMVYIAAINKLVLTINATLEQPEHRISSQKIVYDTKKRVIIAGNKNKKNLPNTDAKDNRVNITLTPKKQTSTQE